MAHISLQDFSFRYRKDQRDILSHINLDFHTDERILILGPSGGGKSTLLLALLRLYTAYDIHFARGNIFFNGLPVEDMSRREILKIFGIVFQSPAQQFCLSSPEEEAAFGLENLKADPAGMDKTIQNGFNRFGFTKKDHKISMLSGGEQQVLAAASTTLLNSRMLVMDEPTAHLDPTGRRNFRSSLCNWLSRDKGFLLVEHHIDLWLDLIQRTIILDDRGRILFDEMGINLLQRENALLSEMGVWLPKQRNLFTSNKTCKKGPHSDSQCYTPALEFKEAGIGYGKKRVVKNLNLKIRKGELVALVGRNGCGKSTILKCMTGLSDLQEGSIHIEGDLYRRQGKRLSLKKAPAYLFQNPEHQFIFPTVGEEVRDNTLPRKEAEKREKEILEKFGLFEKRHQNPFTLSGGEKRRLSLISLLARDHTLFLLDEPTFGQDARTARELVKTIEELYNQGKSLVIVSHDLSLFDGLLNRIVVLNEGSIVFDGSHTELKQYPKEELKLWGVDLP